MTAQTGMYSFFAESSEPEFQIALWFSECHRYVTVAIIASSKNTDSTSMMSLPVFSFKKKLKAH